MKFKKRKPLPKKLRFEVFKRDGFSCQYCGSNPPKVVLECDHIKPVSKGGENEIDNLITACFDCNRGKSNVELTRVPLSISEKHKILIDKDLQFKEYQKLIRSIEKRLRKEENSVENIYTSWFENWELTDNYKKSTIRSFIDKLGIIEVKQSMDKACSKMHNENHALKYFCGICWNKIKGNTYGSY